MTKEEMKVNYQKIYAWMVILNMHDLFTGEEDKPNYPLIGKVWTSRKNYPALERVFFQLYKQAVHRTYADDPKHIFKILMLAVKPDYYRKREKRGKDNAPANTINM